MAPFRASRLSVLAFLVAAGCAQSPRDDASERSSSRASPQEASDPAKTAPPAPVVIDPAAPPQPHPLAPESVPNKPQTIPEEMPPTEKPRQLR